MKKIYLNYANYQIMFLMTSLDGIVFGGSKRVLGSNLLVCSPTHQFWACWGCQWLVGWICYCFSKSKFKKIILWWVINACLHVISKHKTNYKENLKAQNIYQFFKVHFNGKIIHFFNLHLWTININIIGKMG